MNQLQLRARTRLQLAHTRQARQTLKACVQHYFTQAKFKDKKNEIMCFRDVYKSGNNMEKIKKKTYKIQERVALGGGGGWGGEESELAWVPEHKFSRCHSVLSLLGGGDKDVCFIVTDYTVRLHFICFSEHVLFHDESVKKTKKQNVVNGSSSFHIQKWPFPLPVGFLYFRDPKQPLCPSL